MKKGKTKYSIRSMLNGITVPLFILVLITLVVLVYINFQNSDSMIEMQVTQEYINIIESKRDTVNDMIKRIISLINNAFYQEVTLDLISGSVTGYAKFESLQDIEELLLFNKGFGDEYELFYYGENGINFYKNDIIFKNASTFSNTSWYQKASQSPDSLYWFGLEKSEVEDGKYQFIGSLKIDISDYQRGQLKGLAFFAVDESTLYGLLKNIGGTIYIVDDEGVILYDTARRLQGQDVSVLGIDYAADIPVGSQYRVKNIEGHFPGSGSAGNIVIISPPDEYGFSMIHVREQLSVISRYQSLRIMFYMFFLVVVVFIVYYIIIYINTISKPIRMLYTKISAMDHGEAQGSGAPDRQNPITTGIKKLDTELNKIIMENKINLKKISEIERAEQLMEIKKLQAEIDPHFLYNVLGHVKFAAMLDNPDQIIKIIDSLFIILNSKKAQLDHFITVGEEIEILNKYIEIIKMIYEDNIEFTISIDPLIRDCLIPSFILQPIVENCVHHGMNPSVRGGRIAITGSREEGGVRLEVVDNGIGIQEGAITRIMQYHKNTGNKTNEHMGIMNIDKKIKLCCGDEYGIRIESQTGRGTKVIVSLDIREKGFVPG